MSVYSFVFLLCFSLCILYAHSLLLASKRCVPTSVVRKKCMTCICGMDGVYYCKDNCLKKNGTIKEAYSGGGKECDPLRLYRSDRLFCNCDATGQWLSSMCRQKFNSIAAFKAPVKKGPYRESIPCTPKSLYLIDCNVCECGLNGIMDHSSCTDRQCAKASKADKCLYGDVVKTDTELCSCSEVNYYVDRLCIKINSLSVQNIARSALARIIEQHGFIKSAPNKTETCIKHRVYQVDCNQCHCTDHNTLRCSRHECLPETRRFIKNKDFDSLPSLQNRFEDCHPGHKYKFKCNTCICSSKRIPSCTSMVCLEDLVDTKAALRDLPELIEGESCVAGQKYKRDCNICECRSTYELVCSQDVCPSKDNEDPFEETERLASRTTNCTPGEVSNNLKNCEWCYCNVHLEQRCVKKQFVECDDTGNALKEKSRRFLNPRAPVELDPAMISDNETLPVLPYLFSPCRPGNKYQVDCNKCICNDEGNLLCQRNYCFSFNDAHARDAYKMSGTSCRAGEVIFYNCIRCECSKKKMRCNAIPGCRTQSEEILVKSYQAQGMSLDISGSYGARTKECIPNSIYRLDCNKCYCQKDGSLRCTKMTCLNYKQIDGLRKLRNRLEGQS